MVLGVYWYFEFPSGLYEFEYFQYRKGLGGHADNPAELVAYIICENPGHLIKNLERLTQQYKESYLFIRMEGNRLQIGTGSHHLFDYDFEFMVKVETLLKKEAVVLVDKHVFEAPRLIRLFSPKEKMAWPTKDFLRIVGSSIRKNNAETLALRMDCHIGEGVKNAFLEELGLIADAENIRVLYYLEKKYHDRINLMLFFSNGRQGLGLQPKQVIQLPRLEMKIEALKEQYGIEFGHTGNYPDSTPQIIKMVDQEFVLGKR
ncbi:hypothetical protein AAG747_13035 [Rapidithrix thailandica]|uniref:Uncharacterized protein n=1 Tax=Rapidithrix thailandica TaxID=413964 RepID=A0AAW9S910_9BACT